MKRLTALVCITILILAGCGIAPVSEPVPVKEVEKPILPIIEGTPTDWVNRPFTPYLHGDLDDNVIALLTANEIPVGTFPTRPIPNGHKQIKLNHDGYLVQIFVNDQYSVDGLPEVKSKEWQLVDGSGRTWSFDHGTTGFQFRIVIDKAIKPSLSPNEPLELPIKIILPGVRKGDQAIPVEFEFVTADEPKPTSQYGLVFEGTVIDDRYCDEPQPEWSKQNLQLIVCSIPGGFFADHIVALYDTAEEKLRFVVDERFPATGMFWVGWLNEQEFYIATNYSLLVYHVDGSRREILRLGGFKNNPDIAIHGLAWSPATQTMAVVYGTGHDDEMELRLLTDQLKTVKTIAVVDKQWPWRATEGFSRQITRMVWDERGERLAFTKNRDMNVAIYDTRTGKIEDLPGIKQAWYLSYNPTTGEFEAAQKH